jgi:crotonobetainyl-CoA:carnitine CoA-transferase CaiB-like acyl-CoA transferase
MHRMANLAQRTSEDSWERGPLHGLRVLDVSTLFAGPLTATFLADHGADVIKVEHPAGTGCAAWAGASTRPRWSGA